VLTSRAVRGAFALVAIGAVVVAFTRTLDETEGLPLPPVHRILLAGALAVLGLVTAVLAWAQLLPGLRTRDLAPGFLLAQLAKYLPGSVWQGVGQVMDAVRCGAGRGAATVAYGVQLGTQVVAGGIVAVLVVAAKPPGWVLTAGLVGPLGVLLLARRWMATTLRYGARVAPSRLTHLPTALPPQRSILSAGAFSTSTMLLTSLAYANLLAGPLSPRELVGAAGAFALAWTLGSLAIPVPAGLGVREFVLVVALGSQHPTADVLAAAVLLRLILIVVEALLALGVPLAVRSRLPRRTSPPDTAAGT
jgi:glycosyltransferase 2 family protein